MRLFSQPDDQGLCVRAGEIRLNFDHERQPA